MDMENNNLTSTDILERLEDLFVAESDLALYSENQKNMVCAHIRKYFGEEKYIEEDENPEFVRVDLHVIPPTEKRKYITIVTVGMGAMLMNVPTAFADGALARAELMICLPADWSLEDKSNKWKWPAYFLQTVARIPMIENSWFGAGHVVPMNMKLAENTKLNGFLLLEPQDHAFESGHCRLDDGSTVNFLQMIPIYEEEMKFEKSFGTEELIKRMKDVSHIVNIHRLNSCGIMSKLM